MANCAADDFRAWHEARITELYSGAVQQKLRQDREAFMAREGWLCCKEVTDG